MGLTPRGRRLARFTILPLTLAAWIFCATLRTGRPVHAGQAALPTERSIHLGTGRPGSLYALSLGVKDPAQLQSILSSWMGLNRVRVILWSVQWAAMMYYFGRRAWQAISSAQSS